MEKVGLGGGCHWCTEAIFQSLIGVIKVEQGWISSVGVNDSFSEGVVVHFDPSHIDLSSLIAIHLHTHSCTADHSMRPKYRSAVYTYTEDQVTKVKEAITSLQKEFDEPVITEVLPFCKFKINQENYLDYYFRNPENKFCQTYINPKLNLVHSHFYGVVNEGKLRHLIQNRDSV